MLINLFFICLLFLFPFMIHAQSDVELITDRPDQTESSVTVPEKSLQIETGMFYVNVEIFDLI